MAELILDDAFSDNTKTGYASDWKVWSRWCKGSGNSPLPATGEAIAAYIEHAGTTRSPATLSRHIAAIAAAHRMADQPDPTKVRAVKVAMKRLLRQRGKRQRQALGITSEMRDRMRIPMIPTRHSEMMPTTCSDMIATRRSDMMATTYSGMMPTRGDAA